MFLVSGLRYTCVRIAISPYWGMRAFSRAFACLPLRSMSRAGGTSSASPVYGGILAAGFPPGLRADSAAAAFGRCERGRCIGERVAVSRMRLAARFRRIAGYGADASALTRTCSGRIRRTFGIGADSSAHNLRRLPTDWPIYRARRLANRAPDSEAVAIGRARQLGRESGV